MNENAAVLTVSRAGTDRRTDGDLSEVELTGGRRSACRRFFKGFQSRRA